MSNVEYRCPHVNPETQTRDCGNRHFAPPGGTKYRCRHHDVEFVQTEEGKGPDFLFIEEDGRTKSQDAVLADKTRAVAEDRVVGEAHVVPPTGEQVILRDMYVSLTGEQPDLRWGPTRLRQEIADWKEQFTMEQSDNVASEPEVAGERNESDEVSETANDEAEESANPTLEPTGAGQIVDGIPD